MQIPKGATIAVADGQKLSMFRNTGGPDAPKLQAIDAPAVSTTNRSGGAGHSSSAANPQDAQVAEDGFAAGIAELLNAQATSGKLDGLVVVAAPRTLGELRKHYHPKLKEQLVGEVSKDLTGQTSDDIERALQAA